MKIVIVIMAAAIVLAAGYSIPNRYVMLKLDREQKGQAVWILDQFTGEVRICGVASDGEHGCVGPFKKRNSN